MKLSKLFLIVVVLSLLIPGPAHAGDYISDAVEALKTSSVYVAPGTPGTDYNTPAQLGVFLDSETNVVLVMLPPEAIDGTDVLTIARRISDGLNNQKTIGLSVGNQTIGYSVLLPEGVASDLMSRADSVSNNTVTALTAFSRNVQLWLIRNPQPTPIPTPKPTPTPIKLPKASDVSWPVWLLIVAFIIVMGFMFFSRAKKAARRSLRRRSLGPLEVTIRKIRSDVDEIRDRQIKKDLERACQLALGLLEILQQSDEPLGYTEAKFPGLLDNMERQIKAYLRHELGTIPLKPDMLVNVRNLLLSYDELFEKLQSNDPESIDLLTSIIDSNNTMIGTLGYLSEDK